MNKNNGHSVRWRASASAVAAGLLGLGAVASGQPICGSGWGQVAISGPAGRDGHVLTYDSVSGRCILFGGTVQGAHNQETWAYNGVWTNLNPGNRPSPREGMAMAFDPSRNRMVLFSGFSGLTGPGIYGGYENATWEFSTSWATRILTGPAPRAGHVMAFAPAPVNRTILFGGSNRPNLTVLTTKFADTWEWNGVSGTWTQRITDGPGARDFSAMCFDSVRHVCVLFGGYTEVTAADDTWEYDPASAVWTQVDIPGPPGRYDHGLVYDAERQVSVVFGGAGSNFATAGTWQYAGSPVGSGLNGAWSKLLSVNSPGPRDSFGMAYDTVRQRIVLFGGNSGFNYLGDTWEASFHNWPVVTQRPLDTAVEPGCVAAFSVGAESRPPGRVLTYTWQKDGVPLVDDDRIIGSTTSDLTINGVTDSDVGSYDVLISSGCGIVQSTSASLTLDPLTIVTEPVDVAACQDGLAVFTVAATGAGPVSYQWRRDGEALVDDDRVTGSASELLTITGATSSDAGIYDVVLITPCAVAQSGPATLALVDPPAITAQPLDAAVCVGSDATVSVVAIGGDPIAFQWQWSCVDAAGNPCMGMDWVDVSDGDNLNPDTGAVVFSALGAQAATLSIPAGSLAAGGAYSFRCAVSNPCTTVVSNRARIRSNSPDFNGDGDLGTDADIEAFFACLAGNCCTLCGSADFNGDGDLGTDADIESFFRVLGGGPC